MDSNDQLEINPLKNLDASQATIGAHFKKTLISIKASKQLQVPRMYGSSLQSLYTLFQ